MIKNNIFYILITNIILYVSIIFCNPKLDDLSSFYDYAANDINGKLISMNSFKGKSILIVNVASRCGYTSQYQGLQELYETYKDSLVVLGFPSNDFLWQEPGSNSDIKLFCQRTYGVNFPMFEKIHVKGKKKHPIYEWLSESKMNGWNNEAPDWNFNKYLLSKKGELIKVFKADVKPQDTLITKHFIIKSSTK